jgi:hypothetical protein
VFLISEVVDGSYAGVDLGSICDERNASVWRSISSSKDGTCRESGHERRVTGGDDDELETDRRGGVPPAGEEGCGVGVAGERDGLPDMYARGSRVGSVEVDVKLWSGRETGGVPRDWQGLERVNGDAHLWREIEAIGAVGRTNDVHAHGIYGGGGGG